MRKKLLTLLCACLLISTACSLPFIQLTEDENGEQNIELLTGLQDALDIQPAATATPTPSPSGRIDAADTALFSGQIDKAIELYQQAFQQAGDDELKAQALYGLGRSYYDQRQYIAAGDAFNRILGQYPNTEILADTYFMLGQCYEQTDEYLQAAASYQKYAELAPGVLDAYVLTLQGDAAMSGNDYTQAIYAYQAALLADPPADSSSLNLKIGQSYDNLQDYTTAIQYYMNVYNTSQDDYARATSNLLTGQAYLKLDMPDEAHARFLDSVYQFPKAYDSFTALSILVADGVPVNDFVRGLVDYYVGSYDYAIQAFERYLASNPEDNDGTVYYFKGLSHYFNNDPRQAITEYETLINNYPGNAYWSAAWDEKAYVQWVVLDEYTNAANTYLSFVTNASSSPDAPAYLFEAGRVYERSGDLENAAQTWLRMMNEYPSSDLSYRGLFLAGISYYRLAQYEDALQVFQRTLALATTPAEKAKAYMWIGKSYQAQGDSENAQNAYTSSQSADPTDYYAIRSAELLEGRGMFDMEGNFDLGYDLDYERPEGESWLHTTFNIPAETDLNGLGDLENNPRLKRIQAYWEISQFSKAINEAELLRGELQGDVVNLYRLMNYLLELDLYQPAIYTCRNILSLAALDDLSSLTAPIYFTHIRFGAYFREMMVSAANDYGVQPLLLYALVRQESMFNPYITSAVGASGLAQIMPATGKENVDLLGWPSNYESSDLLKGEVSLELGTFYLNRMHKYLSGNTQAALAAYNAGPGNAEEWLSLADGDPDLFLEVIRAQETQDYLMQIMEFLNIYQLVYTRPQ
jgi:soluble lytic murein transglycosylase